MILVSHNVSVTDPTLSSIIFLSHWKCVLHASKKKRRIQAGREIGLVNTRLFIHQVCRDPPVTRVCSKLCEVAHVCLVVSGSSSSQPTMSQLTDNPDSSDIILTRRFTYEIHYIWNMNSFHNGSVFYDGDSYYSPQKIHYEAGLGATCYGKLREAKFKIILESEKIQVARVSCDRFYKRNVSYYLVIYLTYE